MDINEALRIYLGSDSNGGVTPYGTVDRIQSRCGIDSPKIVAELRSLIDGLYEPSEVFNLPSLAEIGDFVTNRARSRRPDLEDDVCMAIGNYVSYSYR